MPRQPSDGPSLSDLTKEELLVLVERLLRERRAASTVPSRKAGPAGAPSAGRTDWTKMAKTCPKCGKEGHVEPDFGVKNRHGVIGPQGWCRKCRNSTRYDLVPKKKRAP